LSRPSAQIWRMGARLSSSEIQRTSSATRAQCSTAKFHSFPDLFQRTASSTANQARLQPLQALKSGRVCITLLPSSYHSSCSMLLTLHTQGSWPAGRMLSKAGSFSLSSAPLRSSQQQISISTGRSHSSATGKLSLRQAPACKGRRACSFCP